jgi:hypothetical protein
MSRQPLAVTVGDLIAAGLIKAPSRATLDYAGRTMEADLTRDGEFRIGDDAFTSPSMAAGIAIARATKRRTHGREYLSVNGWKLWRVRDASGRERPLTEIRADLGTHKNVR